MGKIGRSVYRKDSFTDHAHSLPDGKPTQGMLLKPNASDRGGWHSHLYELDGLVFETSPAYNDATHTHESDIGATSGPMPVVHSPGVELARA